MSEWLIKVEDLQVAVSLSAYAAEDVVGGGANGYLSCDAYAGGGGGVLMWVRVVDAADKKIAGRLYVYDSAPSVMADNAQFAPTVADRLKGLGCISIPSGYWDGSGSFGSGWAAGKDRFTGVPISYPNTSDGKLYFRYVTVAGVTYVATTDLYLHVCLAKR
jgi:hypothetical protein